jgi:tRNA pseudouridine38-40 synthase
VPTWKLTLEYDGTRYRGWQAQKNTDRTVQGVLLRAARELLGADATAGGAGRTDAGVHALAQVAHLKARRKLPPEEILRGLNDALPHDINVLTVEAAPPTFHARHDATSRTYLYRISRRRTAFDKRYVWWVKDRLDFSAMARVADLFRGRHDFASFCENPEGQESTSVVVESSEMIDWAHEIHYRIEASHFLWKMVRRVVGTLVEVGRGNLASADVERLLQERSSEPAAWTAPPSGLFLEKVLYESA